MANMTDRTPGQLDDLADYIATAPGNQLGWLPHDRDDLVYALRLAATMEEFGEVRTPILLKLSDGRWEANFENSIPMSKGTTPIEAMRAAIDAAKPKHEHRWSPWSPDFPDQRFSYYARYCGDCGGTECSDKLSP